MDDSIDESIIITKTFRFASGQLLALDEDQIDKIPYLTAIVSSGDSFESARDEHGHYILDPHIEFKYFAYVLDSLSFHSTRQIFTHLPKKNDIIPVIALFDFLGIGPQSDPNLDEVDSMFFSNLVYSPMLKKYLQIVRPSLIQDMAVRFAVAMAKEEYDFTNGKVMDQIYWFIMFILSANQLFGDRCRHHVFQIAEHCFSLFEPSRLKPLKKLIQRIRKYTRKLVTTNHEDVSPDEEDIRPLEQVLDIHERSCLHWLSLRIYSPLEQRQELLLHRTYSYEDSDSQSGYFFDMLHTVSTEDRLLKPVHTRALEIIYEYFQSEICRRALAELRKRPYKFIQKANDGWYSVRSRIYRSLGMPTPSSEYNFTQQEIDKWILNDIFEYEFVQEEIRECILEEIRELIPKLEKRHKELMKKIQEYDQNREEYETLISWIIDLNGSTYFEYIQEEALSHERLLNKLDQHSIVVEQIHQYILKELYIVARQQIDDWENVEREINDLRQSLFSCSRPEKTTFRTSKTVRQWYSIPTNKPLTKTQFKHSMH